MMTRTHSAALLSLAIAVSALGKMAAVSGPAPVAMSADVGIAAGYPGDVGIESHADVIFAEQFEEPTLADLFGRWTDIKNGATMSFTSDVPLGSSGVRSLNIPWVGGGVSDGGHLYKQLPAVDDTLYVRYYIKYPSTGKYVHEGIWMGGYNPPLAAPNPQAGIRPIGNDRFSAAAEEYGNIAQFDHYNYWMNMRRDTDGNYWGNLLLNNPNVRMNPGQWMCVEHMVKLNNPVTAFNGEHAIWVDGVKISHLGEGFPNGFWAGGDFTQDPNGLPFEGFQWRNDANLRLNWIWLQNYSPADPAGFTGTMLFDHVVVAKSYIGCLPSVPPASPTGLRIRAAVSQVTISPATLTLQAGATQQLTATLTDADGNVLSGRTVTWASSNLAVATVTGAGLVTAVAAGSATITATSEGQSGTVDLTVSVASETTWPNEPAGSTEVTNQPFDVIASLGWNLVGDIGGNVTVATDASAPMSAPNVLQFRYPAGFTGGTSPGTVYRSLPSVRRVYVGMWWKVSNPWQPHSAGDKLQYLFTSANGSLFMIMYQDPVTGSGPYRMRVYNQLSTSPGVYLMPNVNDVTISIGEWHRIEWLVDYAADPSQGVVQWWIDGKLVGDYRNVNFPNADLTEHKIAPVWGGVGETKIQTDYVWYDHVRISRR